MFIVLGSGGCGERDICDELGQPGARGATEAYDNFNVPRLRGFSLEMALDRLPSEGKASPRPWAGSWWPFSKDGIADRWAGTEALSPAEKYDGAFGGGDAKATTWEKENHSGGEWWYGHCDGYSIAAVVEPEPTRSVEHGGLCFQPNDLKGLLTEAYECDMSGQDVELIGQECFVNNAEQDGDGRTVSPSCRDVNPATFHIIAANLLGLHQRGFFVDKEAALEIWNYPVAAFSSRILERKPASDLSEQERRHLAKGTKLVAVIVNDLTLVRPSLPNKESVESYTYALELDADGVIIGGEWQGNSATGNHPDAIKVPHRGARNLGGCNNPFIDYKRLLPLIERAASQGPGEC